MYWIAFCCGTPEREAKLGEGLPRQWLERQLLFLEGARSRLFASQHCHVPSAVAGGLACLACLLLSFQAYSALPDPLVWLHIAVNGDL